RILEGSSTTLELSKPLILLSAADDRFARLTSKSRQRDNALRGLPRPIAGHGDEGGPSSLSAAYGAAADQPGVDQRRPHKPDTGSHSVLATMLRAEFRLTSPSIVPMA